MNNNRIDNDTAKSVEALESAMWRLKNDYSRSNSIPQSTLNDVKRTLNKLFKDAECKDVSFTKNTDKMFFGMCVMPCLNANEIDKLIVSNDPFRVTHYYIEIDSRLLDPTLNLSTREITAVMLHEVGHMVNTAAPMDEVRKELDAYLMKEDETLSIKKSVHYREILLFGIKDSLRKVTSMFESPNKQEIIADEFAIKCGYGDELLSALKRITKNSAYLNQEVNNKFIVFSWCLRLYKNVAERRIMAIRTMRKTKDVTASQLIKKECDAIIARLNKIDDDAINESSLMLEKSIMDKIANARYQYRWDVLRKYEDDYYEFTLRLKSCSNEDDALRLLRDVNTRLSVIEEFLNSEKIEGHDKERFFKLQEKLLMLREELSKKDIKKDKLLGLWVEYPDIVEDRH